MAQPMIKKTTEVDERLVDETEIVHWLAQQLEALARVLTYVKTEGEGDEQDILSPKPADFVCIMQIFQEKLSSMEDIARAVNAKVEDLREPTPMQAV